MTLEELQVVIEAQTSQFKSEINKIQSQIKGATGNINREVNKIKNIFKSLGKFMGGLLIGREIGKQIVDSVKSAMRVEGALQQISRTMGESSNAFLKWGRDHGLAFNLAQSDIANYGAVYSNLLSGFMGSSSATMKGTQELLKASSIIASGTGRTMTDVQERIRSGLLGNTEAIEDLGINVNVAMLESTDAFRRFAGDTSWNKLDFQTQQQIRLFSILEQTTAKFGDSVLNNTASSWQGFVAILKDIQLNLGQAFLPIMNVVLPILSSLAMAIRTVTAHFAVFMQTLFGKPMKTPSIASTMDTAKSSAIGASNAQDGYSDSIGRTGDKAKKTAKEMNRLLGGFDEINSIKDSGADGGGALGGAGGGIGDFGGIGDIDFGLDKEIDTSAVSKMAEKIRSIVKGITDFIKENKEIVISIVAGLVAAIASFFIISKWSFITGLVTTVIGWISLIPTAIGLAFLALTQPAVLISAAIGLVVGAIVYLWQTSEGFRDSVMTIVKGIMDIISRFWNEILKPLFGFLADVFITILKPIAKWIGSTLVIAVEGAFKILESLWKNILEPIANFILDIFSEALKGLIEIWKAWKPVVETIFNVLLWIWNSCFKPLVDYVVGIFTRSFESWGDSVKSVIDGLRKAFSGIVDFIVGVFTGNWSRAWDGVKNIFSGVWNTLEAVAKAPLNAVIRLVNRAIGGINELLSFKVPDWIPGIGGKSVGFTIPNIPQLAKGGIVDSAQMFIAGEAGKEVVMPLENNTGWISDLAQKVYSRMPEGRGDNSSVSGDIIFQIDGYVIGKVALAQLRKMQRQGGITLIPV